MMAYLKMLLIQTVDFSVMQVPYVTVFPCVFRPLEHSTGDRCLCVPSIPVSNGDPTEVAEILGVDALYITLYL